MMAETAARPCTCCGLVPVRDSGVFGRTYYATGSGTNSTLFLGKATDIAKLAQDMLSGKTRFLTAHSNSPAVRTWDFTINGIWAEDPAKALSLPATPAPAGDLRLAPATAPLASEVLITSGGNPSRLYYGDSSVAGVATYAFDLGDDARGAACASSATKTLCAFILAGDKKIVVVPWNDPKTAPLQAKAKSHALTTAPAGLALVFDGTHFVAAVTGPTDDSISFLRFDETGALLSSATTTLATCDAPGPITFFGISQVAVGCTNSKTFEILLAQ